MIEIGYYIDSVAQASVSDSVFNMTIINELVNIHQTYQFVQKHEEYKPLRLFVKVISGLMQRRHDWMFGIDAMLFGVGHSVLFASYNLTKFLKMPLLAFENTCVTSRLNLNQKKSIHRMNMIGQI